MLQSSLRQLSGVTLVVLLLAIPAGATEETEAPATAPKTRMRVIMSSDFPPIGVVKSGHVPNTMKSDPDDARSMVRFLVCSNEFDVEGLIVATGCWRRSQSNTDMLDRIVDAYEKAYDNLIVHANGYPTPEYKRSISVMGKRGMAWATLATAKTAPVPNSSSRRWRRMTPVRFGSAAGGVRTTSPRRSGR